MRRIRILIGLVFMLTSAEKVHCQITDKRKINTLTKTYENLSCKDELYKLEYITNVNTFIFKLAISDSKEIGYKVMLTDIHPEGIFSIELDGKTYIRILSIDNGNRFIKEKFTNGFRFGTTTNIIDIEILECTSPFKIKKVINELKALLASKNIEPEKIQAFELKKTN